MKKLLLSLALVLSFAILVSLISSCEKEELSSPSSEANLLKMEQQIQAEIDAYKAKYDAPPQVYPISLEELNNILIEGGLQPATYEDMGLTEAEYQAAMANATNNPEVSFRYYCNRWYLGVLCDVDQDNDVDRDDILLVRDVIGGISAPDRQSNSFAYITYYCDRFEPEILNNFDIFRANRYMLGFCCE